MTNEQRERLRTLSEKLCDRVLVDADPENWSCSGMFPQDLSAEQRGNAHWDRKLASGTLTIFCRVESILEPVADPYHPMRADYNPEADIKRAESQARKILKRISEQRAES